MRYNHGEIRYNLCKVGIAFKLTSRSAFAKGKKVSNISTNNNIPKKHAKKEDVIQLKIRPPMYPFIPLRETWQRIYWQFQSLQKLEAAGKDANNTSKIIELEKTIVIYKILLTVVMPPVPSHI